MHQPSSLRRDWKLTWLVLACVFFCVAPNLTGSVVLSDPFHDGEYFAVAVNYFSQLPKPFHPLSIHGALDYIPALIARYGWGDELYFLPTAAIYSVLDAVAALLLLLITHELCRGRSLGWLVVLGMAVGSSWFVGYRDLLLLGCLYTFLMLSGRSWKLASNIALLVLLGALVGFGMFWSFDRGVATAVCVGPPMLLMAWRNRINLVAAAALGITIILPGLFFDGFALSAYLENFNVLLQTSSQWSYGWRLHAVILTCFVAALNVLAIALTLRAFLISAISLQDAAGALALTLLSLIMLKIGVNRADVEHVFNGLWAPLLLMLSLPRQTFAIGKLTFAGFLVMGIAAALSFKYHHVGFFVAACVMTHVCIANTQRGKLPGSRVVTSLCILACASAVTYGGFKHYREGQYQWIAHIFSPPSNVNAVTPGVEWASQRLHDNHAQCVFDLSNNGVINGLLALPSCTRFTYPVYAAQHHETELIRAVEETAPSAIVYSSTFPSYSIDGVTMRDRFKVLDSMLVARYPREECAQGYCVRYLAGQR